jgi:hypothetical protein
MTGCAIADRDANNTAREKRICFIFPIGLMVLYKAYSSRIDENAFVNQKCLIWKGRQTGVVRNSEAHQNH